MAGWVLVALCVSNNISFRLRQTVENDVARRAVNCERLRVYGILGRCKNVRVIALGVSEWKMNISQSN